MCVCIVSSNLVDVLHTLVVLRNKHIRKYSASVGKERSKIDPVGRRWCVVARRGTMLDLEMAQDRNVRDLAKAYLLRVSSAAGTSRRLTKRKVTRRRACSVPLGEDKRSRDFEEKLLFSSVSPCCVQRTAKSKESPRACSLFCHANDEEKRVHEKKGRTKRKRGKEWRTRFVPKDLASSIDAIRGERRSKDRRREMEAIEQNELDAGQIRERRR